MSKTAMSTEAVKPKNLLEDLQESLIRRFSKVPRKPEPIVYEFTNDRALLHQYYRLREIMYRRTFQTDQFSGEEDTYDKISHILIARRGKLCVGGCRLTIREADENFMLPLESQEFKLRDAFPHLGLVKQRHAEISRLAVMDEDNDKLGVVATIAQLTFEKAIDAGAGYVFFKSTLPTARNWRKVISVDCGLPNVKICMNVKVPEISIHPDVTWYITKVTLPAGEEAQKQELVTMQPDSLVH